MRVDPSLTAHAACPACGAGVSVEPGEATPDHQPAGERAACPGSGQPAL